MQIKGVLFPNDRKSADNQPDFKGSLEIDGKKMDLAAWKNSKGEKRWLSIKASEPRNASDGPSGEQRPAPRRAQEPPPSRNLDDEIPF